jgi:hypothetical protein
MSRKCPAGVGIQVFPNFSLTAWAFIPYPTSDFVQKLSGLVFHPLNPLVVGLVPKSLTFIAKILPNLLGGGANWPQARVLVWWSVPS